ncbi:hypothetical protein LMG28688_05167 [Paraburkholderia caffeinitolerans]|uniref:Lipoprotein n=1 Tax=Paraburkholderia caffeinitolerans TaxID=1723730 RepID=A0A6J5GGS6_9BURK|nr:MULTISPECIES: hypothetical protein [Paraburkholderia]CAB3800502.1 hypothetical protein LMG28688_05167 [Paraburkholderia caffeinitolerans]
MKTSTLMATVLLSASCFAAPVHTQDAQVDRASATAHAPFVRSPMDDAPVAPPAPDIPVASTGTQHWKYLTLPKSHRLDQSVIPVLHQQT